MYLTYSAWCSFFAGLVLGAISLTAFSCLWKVVKVYTSRQVRYCATSGRQRPAQAQCTTQQARYRCWLGAPQIR